MLSFRRPEDIDLIEAAGRVGGAAGIGEGHTPPVPDWAVPVTGTPNCTDIEPVVQISEVIL